MQRELHALDHMPLRSSSRVRVIVRVRVRVRVSSAYSIMPLRSSSRLLKSASIALLGASYLGVKGGGEG